MEEEGPHDSLAAQRGRAHRVWRMRQAALLGHSARGPRAVRRARRTRATSRPRSPRRVPSGTPSSPSSTPPAPAGSPPPRRRPAAATSPNRGSRAAAVLTPKTSRGGTCERRTGTGGTPGRPGRHGASHGHTERGRHHHRPTGSRSPRPRRRRTRRPRTVDQDNLYASWPLAHPSERRAHRERAILLVNAAYRVLGLDPAPAHLRDEPLHPVPGQPGPVTADNDPELARLRADSDRLRSLLHGGGPE